jgi:hypothetical protein
MCHVTIDGVPAQPPSGPAPRPSRRRWLVVVVCGWTVLVVVLAGYAVRRGEPTVRAQTSIAQALPAVDRAIADVVAAAEPTGAVAEIGGYREISGRCTITAVRDGARYERVAHLYVPVGRESALLTGIAARLPRDYDAQVRRSGYLPFTADAGDYVALQGGISGPGEVRLAADTGCRPLTGPVSEPRPSPPAGNRAPVEAVLAALKVSDARWQTHRVGCVRGGSVVTVRADGRAGAPVPSPADALRAIAPGAIVTRPDLYVYRSGPAGVVVRTGTGVVTVAATTGCATT